MKKDLKIIFLDVDGVLNSDYWNNSHQKEISDGSLIDLDKVKLLKLIINQTDAKVVLHSGWRFWFDKQINPIRDEAQKLVTIFQKYQIEIFDCTPDYSDEEIKQTRKFSLVKAKEILSWLCYHQNVTKWIVIDDLDLQNDEISRHQIRTNNKIGLTLDDVNNAIGMLI